MWWIGRLLLLAWALTKLCGCAALIDPAHHGTAFMRAQWAKAEPCVILCDAKYPNKMTEVVRDGDTCMCRTSIINMGASYYADDHAPIEQEQSERFKIMTPEQVRSEELKIVAELASAAQRTHDEAAACLERARAKKALEQVH